MDATLAKLLDKYLEDNLSETERIDVAERLRTPQSRAELEELIDAQFRNDHIAGLSSPGQGAAQFERLLRSMEAGAAESQPPKIHVTRRPIFRKLAVAAAILILLVGASIYILQRRQEQPTPTTVTRDLSPGHAGAILHLSNGNTIVLDSAADGTVARQGGVEAVKIDGQLKYTGKTNELVYNIISTDRGRIWQLTLPDGTKVWLNAASSIRYPISFIGPVREVSITGEAYFEVVHNTRQPFRVLAGDQAIEDVGTQFDVNAYADEPAMKTTLAEGAVRIGAIILKPGQQATLINNKITVTGADLQQVLAWKDGRFEFQHTDLGTLLRQISRWYDVDISYETDKYAAARFSGGLSRNLELSKVLRLIETGGVHYKLVAKKILIIP
jgi:transmembrane sensor